ncbi:MAG: DUF5666 domain-containing protein [Anaerolineales bacterium]
MRNLGKLSRPLLASLLALTLIVSLAPTAMAAPTLQEEEVDLKGVVTSIDETAGTFTMEVEDDLGNLESYTVEPPGDFDLSTLEVGDEVEVEGLLEDGVVLADKVEVDEPDDDEDGEEEGEDGENFFCANSDESHPVAQSLADRYELTYEEVMGWFCEGNFGFGNIMLALQTATLAGEDAGTYLDRRTGGEGWGQIWQDLDLIGRPEEAGPPEWAGPPENAGPPEDRGRPEDAGPPEWAGPPDHAGPKEGRGPQ